MCFPWVFFPKLPLSFFSFSFSVGLRGNVIDSSPQLEAESLTSLELQVFPLTSQVLTIEHKVLKK